MKRLMLIVLPFVVGCSAPATLSSRAIPLAYTTMASPGDLLPLADCIELQRVTVVDARTEQVIGKRFIEGDREAAADVTAVSDVASWAEAGAEEIVRRSGIELGTSGASSLRLSIQRIAMVENVYRRAGYEARIAVDAELVNAVEQSCWQGHAEESASNYGYEGSVENYQETLNHALDRTVRKIIGSFEFERAACGACGE